MNLPPGWSVSVDRTGREEWYSLLRSFDDAVIMQAWDFPEAVCPGQRVSRLTLKRGETVVGMAQVRIAALPILRRGIAYVAFGPLWQARGAIPDLRVFDTILGALRQEYATRRKLLLRVLPFMYSPGPGPDPTDPLQQAGFRSSRNGPAERSLLVDLSGNPEEIRSGFEKECRRCLRRAEQAPLQIEVGTSPNLYDDFSRVYRDMLERKNLDATIDIPRWRKLQGMLPDRDRPRIFLAYHDGMPVSGLIVSALGTVAYPIAAATHRKAMDLKAAYLLHWKVMEWAREEGCRQYALVGLDPERDMGTYRFKKGFGGKESCLPGPFEYCRDPLSRLITPIGESARSAFTALRKRTTPFSRPG